MKRRDFLKKSFAAGAGIAAAPLMLGGIPIRAFGANSPLGAALTQSSPDNDNILILVQLAGGNDGLNTIIPLDQLTLYNQYRPKVGLQTAAAAKSAGDEFWYVPYQSTDYAFVNTMDTANVIVPDNNSLFTMFGNGLLDIIQGVTYPNPSLSHFVGINNWLTGMDGNTYPPINSGWMGRYLQDVAPTFLQEVQQAVADKGTLDPLAIQIGSSLSPAFQGPQGSMGISFASAQEFTYLIDGKGGAAYSDPLPTGAINGANELSYVQTIIDESNIFAQSIVAAAANGKNSPNVTYPSDPHAFAEQLKIVAQLISGGLTTKVYLVYISGFDTHSGQNSAGGHPALWQYVSEGIAAFYNDLVDQGLDSRVVGMTFSEFGRRVKDNGNGTDHGTAAPMFVFGTPLKQSSSGGGGVIGTNPSLSSLDSNGNLLMQYDYRIVYWSLLQEWLGANLGTLQDVVNNTQTVEQTISKSGVLPLIANPLGVAQTNNVLNGFTLNQNYPNPFNSVTTIEYTVDSYRDISLKIFAENGREVTTLVEAQQHYGRYSVTFNASGLPSGFYIARLQSGGAVLQKVMQLVR